MTRQEDMYNDLLEVLKEIKGYGLKVFIRTDARYAYGFIVTENDNVLYIEASYFYGYDFSLRYIPTEENGRGYKINGDPITEISKSIIEQLESDGLDFAHGIKAPLYKNSEEFFNELWSDDFLKEV